MTCDHKLAEWTASGDVNGVPHKTGYCHGCQQNLVLGRGGRWLVQPDHVQAGRPEVSLQGHSLRTVGQP